MVSYSRQLILLWYVNDEIVWLKTLERVDCVFFYNDALDCDVRIDHVPLSDS